MDGYVEYDGKKTKIPDKPFERPPTVYDPNTEESYPKPKKKEWSPASNRQKKDMGVIPARPIGEMETPIQPPTTREFDEMYFQTQGNPFMIDPMTEVNRASSGLEQLFEDTFYQSYADIDKLDKDDLAKWEKIKKSYNGNIYKSVQTRKAQQIKEYELFKGYNSEQRSKYDRAMKETKAQREKVQSTKEGIEKELYMLEKEAAGLDPVSDEEKIDLIEKRKKQVESKLKNLPQDAKRQIVETRVWKGRTVYKLDDGSIVFADETEKAQ